jgi:hypothetical protein
MKVDDEKQNQFFMTITDEDGSFVCRKLPFNEDGLMYIAIEVDGLEGFIRQYEERTEGDPCENCDCSVEGCQEDCDDLEYYNCLVCEEDDRWYEEERELEMRKRNPK